MPQTGDGSLEVTWIGHATVLLELGGLRLVTDPVLGRRVFLLRRIAPAVPAAAVAGVDAVLISHAHADHLDPSSVRRLPPAARILGPPAVCEWLAHHDVPGAHAVTAGSEVSLGAVTVEAVRALHDGRRWPHGGPRECVGFLVRGAVSAYFPGDTDLYPEMAALKGAVDVALLPIWGWGPTLGEGHMDPERAAQALAAIEPRVAIPVHWGTLGVPWARPSREELHEPVVAFAEAAARLAPQVEVRVLEPGESTLVEARAPQA